MNISIHKISETEMLQSFDTYAYFVAVSNVLLL